MKHNVQTPDPKKVLKLQGDSIPEGANPLGDLTALDGDATVKDTVNETTDKADYFSFTLTEWRELTAGLEDLDGDAGFYLEDTNETKLQIRDSSWTTGRKFVISLEMRTYLRNSPTTTPGDPAPAPPSR